MLILLTGLIVGLAAVVPIGPISMTVVGVAVQRGRRAGAQAAAGVVGGEVIAAGSAVVLAVLGAQLPPPLFVGVQIVAVAMLVLVGVMLIIRTERLGAMANDLERPGSVLFALTALSPITVGSWLAILLASPFVAQPVHLGLFVAGIIIASGIWHPVLAMGAATIGPRLTQPMLMRLTRLGGICMIGLAAAMALSGS